MTDYSTLMPGDALVALRSLPRRVSAALGVFDESTEARAHQIGREGVSAVEAILSATATLAVLEKGLYDVSTLDDPPLHPAVTDRGLRSVELSTAEPTEAVLDQFSERITTLVDLAETIKGREWSRTGVAGEAKVTALDLLRESVSVGVDALALVERTIASVA